MSKPVTVIVPSYCPDETVRGYETRCLVQLAQHTPRDMYDLIIMQGGDWSYPQKVNAAMTGVRTEYTVILSNDIFVGPYWLDEMIRSYERLNCGLLSPQDNPEIKWVEREHWWALVMISLDIWKEIGTLDETLPKVYHDQDYSIRAAQKGYESLRTPNVLVEHVGSATRSRVGTMDDTGERARMVERYGCAELHDWINKRT